VFQVGALNPNVGNDRRNQLVAQLMQQLQQSRASQVVGSPAPYGASFIDLVRRRQMQMTPGLTRPANAGRDTAGSALTAANSIPGALSGLLGPGAAARPSGFASSVVPGFAVPRPMNAGHPIPSMLGSAIPSTRPFASAPPQMLAPASGPARIPEPVPASNANPSVGLPAAPALATVPVAGTASNGAPNAPLVGQDAKMAGGAAASGFTPNGYVPIGNGVFYDPATGNLYGNTGSLGGSVRGVLGRGPVGQ
jgi:hypothetical protein